MKLKYNELREERNKLLNIKALITTPQELNFLTDLSFDFDLTIMEDIDFTDFSILNRKGLFDLIKLPIKFPLLITFVKSETNNDEIIVKYEQVSFTDLLTREIDTIIIGNLYHQYRSLIDDIISERVKGYNYDPYKSYLTEEQLTPEIREQMKNNPIVELYNLDCKNSIFTPQLSQAEKEEIKKDINIVKNSHKRMKSFKFKIKQWFKNFKLKIHKKLYHGYDISMDGYTLKEKIFLIRNKKEFLAEIDRRRILTTMGYDKIPKAKNLIKKKK